MDHEPTADIFCLARIDGHSWRILNRRYPADDERHSVARITDTTSDEVRVHWTQSIPLPTAYRTALDALEDVTRWGRGAARATRPIPIPHIRPPQ